ncbi:MAG: hypothetical protein R3264_13915 [Anaerolineae bacterium]|nr:hypothetical protein [Anaerolineae bacterium]
MIGRIFSTLPLIFFAALVAFAGYFTFTGPIVAPVAQRPTRTPTATLLPSPTATAVPATDTPTAIPTATATHTPPPTETPTLTITPTVSEATLEPTLTPAPTVTPTLAPVSQTFVWVQTSIDLNTPPHTLGLISPDAETAFFQEHAVAPALSADASQIAFYSESNLAGLNTGIYIGNIVGGELDNPQQLVDITDVQNIVWSTDAEAKLAFEIILNPDNPPAEWQSQIRIIRANIEDGYVELDRFDGRQPTWSPNGQSLIFYTCRGSQCGLFLADCTGGNCDEASAKQITRDSTDAYPVWSPTGNFVAFTSRRNGNQEIYLLGLTDDQPQNLSNRATIDTTPIFSKDGQTIYFRTDFDGEWQIQAIDLTTMAIEDFIPNTGGSDRDWGLVRPVAR